MDSQTAKKLLNHLTQEYAFCPEIAMRDLAKALSIKAENKDRSHENINIIELLSILDEDENQNKPDKTDYTIIYENPSTKQDIELGTFDDFETADSLAKTIEKGRVIVTEVEHRTVMGWLYENGKNTTKVE